MVCANLLSRHGFFLRPRGRARQGGTNRWLCCNAAEKSRDFFVQRPEVGGGERGVGAYDGRRHYLLRGSAWVLGLWPPGAAIAAEAAPTGLLAPLGAAYFLVGLALVGARFVGAALRAAAAFLIAVFFAGADFTFAF